MTFICNTKTKQKIKQNKTYFTEVKYSNLNSILLFDLGDVLEEKSNATSSQISEQLFHSGKVEVEVTGADIFLPFPFPLTLPIPDKVPVPSLA